MFIQTQKFYEAWRFTLLWLATNKYANDLVQFNRILNQTKVHICYEQLVNNALGFFFRFAVLAKIKPKYNLQDELLMITFSMHGSTSPMDVPDLSKHCLDLAWDSPIMHSSEHGLHADQDDQLLFAFLWTRRFSEKDSKIRFNFLW